MDSKNGSGQKAVVDGLKELPTAAGQFFLSLVEETLPHWSVFFSKEHVHKENPVHTQTGL